jgi:rare lipoprotein A
MRYRSWILMFALLAQVGCAGTGPPRGPSLERDVQVGFASYYDSRFHGARTASGERYDEKALTAAHRTLPFGTRVQVTNLTNGRSVIVTITDRGPFAPGRVIDVSRRAARRLDFLRDGTARVRLRVVDN